MRRSPKWILSSFQGVFKAFVYLIMYYLAGRWCLCTVLWRGELRPHRKLAIDIRQSRIYRFIASLSVLADMNIARRNHGRRCLYSCKWPRKQKTTVVRTFYYHYQKVYNCLLSIHSQSVFIISKHYVGYTLHMLLSSQLKAVGISSVRGNQNLSIHLAACYKPYHEQIASTHQSCWSSRKHKIVSGKKIYPWEKVIEVIL